MLAFEETEQVSVEYVDDYLSNNSDVTHVAFVHCETTTGILNPIKELSHIVKMHGKKLIVDCMSSFGGIPLDVNELGIDFLISSSNKCIQGVPGFGFIIARRSELMRCKGVARSLSLDIYDQWETMEKGHGKWRFTSPTHVVRAFKQALAELLEEGGVEARSKATQIKVDAEGLTPEKLAEYQKAQGAVTSALGKLLAITENYPDLKANQNFLELQAQLEGAENRINVARKNFNDAAQSYNTNIRRFPKNIFAGMFGFDKKAYFEAEEGSEKAPKVEF